MGAQQKKETRLFQERSTEKKICKRAYITVFDDLLNETIKIFGSSFYRYYHTLLYITQNLNHYQFLRDKDIIIKTVKIY